MVLKPTRPNDAPGYKCKANRDGTWREYWACRDDIRRSGFKPTNVRLHYPNTRDGRSQLVARCQRLQGEMLAWRAAGDTYPIRRYDGTIRGLIHAFQTEPDSPYRLTMKFNTAKHFDYCAGIVVDTVGERNVAALAGPDFLRWHRRWCDPREPGKPSRPARASNCIDATRRAVSWGASMGWADCIRLLAILRPMRFAKTPARRKIMQREHVEAIRRAAHAMDLGSVALCTVLQFELMFRQADCVGQWAPCDDVEAGGIVHADKRWGGGLIWADIGSDMVLRKRTTKTDELVEHDLRLHPTVLEELALIPSEKRVGPLILFERTGEPYKYQSYGITFRKVANAAGIPRDVWSMDARAGAITEAYDLGADQTDVMKSAAHRDPRMSSRYNRGSLKQTDRVARLRLRGQTENDREGRG